MKLIASVLATLVLAGCVTTGNSASRTQVGSPQVGVAPSAGQVHVQDGARNLSH